MLKITTPLTDETVCKLRTGDRVLLSGTVYTARDAAHARFMEAFERGEDLPFPLEGAVIYYVGPAPAKPGRVIGSAGPTTSGRMDVYTPALLERGLKGMIGKGSRSRQVREAITAAKAVYFAATGGAAALLAKCIMETEIIAYPELGPEAVRRLEVRDLPLTVVNDIYGGDLYEEGRKRYARL
ncbi:MAG: Fe-S-containing hydro-lyase [Firmicutes bacterium]|nr:Fe-S-containing hydro-lyase [Bacillota bacterium]